jgi:2Fe-2S ferredoxin
MVQIIYLTHDGAEHRLDTEPGISLMRLATSEGIPGIDGECGGVLSCATCHVHVDARWYSRLPAPEQAELDMLELAEGPSATSRLCCQIEVAEALDGLVVRVPESQ